ncbi:hypothetical protein D3C76_1345680 [compost metagenome]
MSRDFVDGTKKTGVSLTGAFIQSYDMRRSLQHVARLVKSDMSIMTKSKQLEIDLACIFKQLTVFGSCFIGISCIS